MFTRNTLANPATPSSFEDAVRSIANRDSLDLRSHRDMCAACAKGAREYPALHDAWRSAGFPAVTPGSKVVPAAGMNHDIPSSFRDAVHRIAETRSLDLDTRTGRNSAAAAAARDHPELHEQWRQEGFPPLFDR